MAEKKKLTSIGVERIKPPPSGQRDHFDAALPGFALRVTAKGVRSFVLLYRHGGKLRRMTLGRYPVLSLAEARDEARAALQQVEKGIDPAYARAQYKSRRVDTFDNVLDDFIERYAKKQTKHWEETERIFGRHVLPRWRDRPIESITRRDAHELLDAIAANGTGVMANRVLAHVRKLFNWAIDRDIVDGSPVARIKPPAKEAKRERVLTEDEIKGVWTACDGIGFPFGPMIQLLLITGQRRSEVAGIRWSELDLDNSAWTIPAEKNKAGRGHEVPLSGLAVTIIDSLPRQSGDFVFSTTDGRKPVSGFSKAKNAVVEQCGFGDWRLHDLRRTAATNMARLDISSDVIGKVLNHAAQGVTARVYDQHTYLPQKQRALNAWGDRLETIIGSVSKNVVPLHG